MSEQKQASSCLVNNSEQPASLNTNSFSTNISGVIYATNLHIGAGNNAVNNERAVTESQSSAACTSSFSLFSEDHQIGRASSNNELNRVSSDLRPKKRVTKERTDTPCLLQYANKARDEGLFNDITIEVGGEYISANRMVLSCYSPFLKDKLKLKNNQEQVITIPELEAEPVKVLVEFIYTGLLSIDDENVIQLLTAANKLELDDAQQFCFEFLESMLNEDNSLLMLEVAIRFNNESLSLKANKLITKNFGEVSNSEKFKCASAAVIHSCITNLDRRAVDEVTVFQTILTWIRCDKEKRFKEFLNLFEAIRLERLPCDYLLNTVSKEEMVRDLKPCINLVHDALPKAMEFEKLKKSGSKILNLGGDESPSQVVEVYSSIDEPAKQYPDLPTKLKFHSSVRLGSFIYCIGGCCVGEIQKSASDEVWEIDLSQDKMTWKAMPKLRERREYVSAAAYFNSLVVCGGGNAKKILKACEIYDSKLQQWERISPLVQKRLSHSLIACSNHLYAIGGWSNMKLLASVERLSDLKSKWKSVKSMQTARDCFAAVNCKDFIYVTGGRSDCEKNTSLKSVEKYNPVGDIWESVRDMNIARSAHSACVLHGKIFVVGGLDSNGAPVKEIECYDPALKKWSVVAATEKSFFYHATVVV